MPTLTSQQKKEILLSECNNWEWVKSEFGDVAYAVVSASACQRALLEADGLWKEPETGNWGTELGEVARALSEGKAIALLTDFERKWFLGDAALALVSADTDQVKGYVYESAKIPEVRGASALLEDLNKEGAVRVLQERLGIPAAWIIYAGGGSFLIVTAARLAEETVNDITALYPATTLTATITAVQQPVPLPDLQAALGKLTHELGRRLKVAKLQKRTAPHFDTLPPGEFCAVCGIRPARKRSQETPDLLCPSCAQKRGYSDRERTLEEFASFLMDHPQLRAGYHGEPPPKAITWAESLRDIGQLGNGYVGAVLADGDDIGRLVHSLRTLQEFHDFANKLEETIQEAVFCSLATRLHCHALSPARGRFTHVHPFEIIAMGGDDLFLIVPASAAFDVGVSIMETFTEAKPCVVPSHLEHHHWGMSAGILICPDHFPIYFMHAMASELLARAKRETRRDIYARRNLPDERGRQPESHVDFLILKGAAAPRRQVEHLMSVLYEPAQHEEVRLTERPYSLSRFQDLLEIARQLKKAGLARTQVQAMAEAFYHGREQATIEILYRVSRLDKQSREVLDDLMEKEARRSAGVFSFPWKEYVGARLPYRTSFLDVLELYEFARPAPLSEGEHDADAT